MHIIIYCYFSIMKSPAMLTVTVQIFFSIFKFVQNEIAKVARCPVTVF